MISIKPFGDRAILIEFEQKISPEINGYVAAFYQALRAENIHGVIDFVPGYCSLMVYYDIQLIQYSSLKDKILSTYQVIDFSSLQKRAAEAIDVPVCFEVPYALDLHDVCSLHQMEKGKFIEVYTSLYFRVYMLGFLPGFTYMGTLPQHLSTPRKQTPRLRVPAGSVGLAGIQTGIYPSLAPGGWQIIGRTPLKPFNPKRENPFLFRQGDIVTFSKISVEEFQALENKV